MVSFGVWILIKFTLEGNFLCLKIYISFLQELLYGTGLHINGRDFCIDDWLQYLHIGALLTYKISNLPFDWMQYDSLTRAQTNTILNK